MHSRDDWPSDSWIWLEMFPQFVRLLEGNERTRELLARSTQQIELSCALLKEKVPSTRPTTGQHLQQMHAQECPDRVDAD